MWESFNTPEVTWINREVLNQLNEPASRMIFGVEGDFENIAFKINNFSNQETAIQYSTTIKLPEFETELSGSVSSSHETNSPNPLLDQINAISITPNLDAFRTKLKITKSLNSPDLSISGSTNHDFQRVKDLYVKFGPSNGSSVNTSCGFKIPINEKMLTFNSDLKIHHTPSINTLELLYEQGPVKLGIQFLMQKKVITTNAIFNPNSYLTLGSNCHFVGKGLAHLYFGANGHYKSNTGSLVIDLMNTAIQLSGYTKYEKLQVGGSIDVDKFDEINFSAAGKYSSERFNITIGGRSRFGFFFSVSQNAPNALLKAMIGFK